MHQTRPHPRFITIKPHTMTQNMRHRVTSPSKVHDTTTSTHPPTPQCRPGTPQCTPQQTTNKNKKVHWHTIEFSNNNRTPNNQPHNQSQRQAAETKLHTRKHSVKSNQTSQTRNRPQAATLFTLIIPSKRLGRSSATRDNLTTNQQTTQIAWKELVFRRFNHSHARLSRQVR